jgi:hypothetical protein
MSNVAEHTKKEHTKNQHQIADSDLYNYKSANHGAAMYIHAGLRIVTLTTPHPLAVAPMMAQLLHGQTLRKLALLG